MAFPDKKMVKGTRPNVYLVSSFYIVITMVMVILIYANIASLHGGFDARNMLGMFGTPRKRIALVTLSDDYYMPCALQLVENIRGIGGWTRDLYVLTIDGIRPEDFRRLMELDAIVLNTSSVLDEWVPSHQHVKKFRKMDILFNPIFRQYDQVVYLDADGTIGGPLDALLDVKFPEGNSILLRDNGLAIGKGFLYGNEFKKDLSSLLDESVYQEFTRKFPDHSSPGATSFFVLDIASLKDTETLIKDSIHLLCKVGEIIKYHDQSLMLLQFYHESAIFPSCVLEKIRVIDRVEDRWRYCKEVKKRLKNNQAFKGQMYHHGYKKCRRPKV
eukprot:Plantae.Rhodophyta-Hildenbrandia_rubra.ctg48351.p1 GENE.Plantae.Rhodophyta-Hildenbrandia_rubra.ctg48351~~Plantae.Rhodophyta-Hildenbrandia_rubra.ctg48351.p1  ORF type:complete len:329 (-),score=30.82 Plantae.Rhodophyta-Hildenbrandia_rubra.ctg48351:1359-2345(-)